MDVVIHDSYFADEEREGFLVPGKMKRAWAAELKMLRTFAEVCGRYGLRWWADYGTLLGAVRHGGYVPWDDDIDLAMPRRDYMTLQKLWRREFPASYEIRTSIQDPGYSAAWMTLYNRHRTDAGGDREAAELTESFFGCPYICGIDIFPLDTIPVEGRARHLLKELLGLVYNTAVQYPAYMADGTLEDRLAQIESMTGRCLPRGEESRRSLWQCGEDLSMISEPGEDTALAVTAEWALRGEKPRPPHCYEETVALPFEMLELPAPCGYEEVLELLYGEDWRRPVRGLSDHAYPFYAAQEA